jgi:hypothetical protein
MRHDTALRIACLYEGARRAQLSWLVYEGVPLLTVDYEQALRNCPKTVRELCAFLGVPATEAATAFLEPELRHV